MKIRILATLLFTTFFCTICVAQTKPVKQQAGKTIQKPHVKKPVSAVKTEVSQPTASAERLVEISTSFGVMVAKLYNSTPLHRDNFIKLVQQGFYDSLLFHRIIDQFMIQGGDPTSRNADANTMLGSGSVPGDRIPAEFLPTFYHKKGALAAARDNNPEKASSNCQFYIVQGKKIGEEELNKNLKDRINQSNPSFNYAQSQTEVYSRIGGTPFLDQSYTVFGEVISGLNVIDKIAKAPKGSNDRPIENIRMKIRLLN